MLKPRVTDQFGRYRRLLYPGTFTLASSQKDIKLTWNLILFRVLLPLLKKIYT